MPLEFVGREDELLFGHRVGRVGIIVGKRIHGECTLDDNRCIVALVVEHHSAAKAADADLSRFVEHRIGPDVGNPRRRARLGLGTRPGPVAIEVERTATGQEETPDRDSHRDDASKHVCCCHWFINGFLSLPIGSLEGCSTAGIGSSRAGSAGGESGGGVGIASIGGARGSPSGAAS